VLLCFALWNHWLLAAGAWLLRWSRQLKGRAAAKERTIETRNNEPNFQILNFQRELIRPCAETHHTKLNVFAWNLKAVRCKAERFLWLHNEISKTKRDRHMQDESRNSLGVAFGGTACIYLLAASLPACARSKTMRRCIDKLQPLKKIQIEGTHGKQTC